MGIEFVRMFLHLVVIYPVAMRKFPTFTRIPVGANTTEVNRDRIGATVNNPAGLTSIHVLDPSQAPVFGQLTHPFKVSAYHKYLRRFGPPVKSNAGKFNISNRGPFVT
jgi:hypothetical protein